MGGVTVPTAEPCAGDRTIPSFPFLPPLLSFFFPLSLPLFPHLLPPANISGPLRVPGAILDAEQTAGSGTDRNGCPGGFCSTGRDGQAGLC